MSENQQPPWPEGQEPRQQAQGRQQQPRNVTPAQAPATAASPAQSRALVTYEEVRTILTRERGVEARAIQAMLGGDKRLYQRFVATTFSLLAKQSEVLRDATPISIVQAIKDAAAMGLEPLTTDGGIVVYGSTATFLPQWQGHLKRIRNSGKVQDIDVQVVYEADDFTWGYTERGGTFSHKPAKDRGDSGYSHAYAYAVMPSGFVNLDVMTEAEILEVRNRFARGYQRPDSPWVKSPGEMYRKTVLRRLEKRLPAEAVDVLLAAELRADEAANARAIAAEVTVERDPVRDMALQAVGALPATAETGEAQAQE